MEEDIRINKYLSMVGFCSRRQADTLLDEGRVSCGDRTLKKGDRVSSDAVILVDGREIRTEKKKVLIAFNKPRGIVTTTGRYKDNIIDYIHYPQRIYPIGRLDKDSSGLILLTNRGELVNAILKASNYHEKEYVVRVDKDITEEFLRGMRGGVPILDTVTRECEVVSTGKRQFRIILTQGLNRQIRRMCEYFGYRVRELKRVRIMNIKLSDLKEGTYRDVSDAELKELYRMIRNGK